MNFVNYSLESLFARTIGYIPTYDNYEMSGSNFGFRGIVRFSNGTVFTSDDVKTICGSTDIKDVDSLAKYCAALAVDFSKNAVV